MLGLSNCKQDFKIQVFKTIQVSWVTQGHNHADGFCKHILSLEESYAQRGVVNVIPVANSTARIKSNLFLPRFFQICHPKILLSRDTSIRLISAPRMEKKDCTNQFGWCTITGAGKDQEQVPISPVKQGAIITIPPSRQILLQTNMFIFGS